VQKVRADGIFATWVAATFVSRLVPQFDAVNLSFVFKSYEDAMRTVEGPVGRLMEAKEKVALTDLKAMGLQFDPVPRETRVALRKAAGGVIDGMKRRLGAELVDKAEADRTGRR
jgi:TRAP-type C4-dicarboxylate transport system substrate-binding protein